MPLQNKNHTKIYEFQIEFQAEAHREKNGEKPERVVCACVGSRFLEIPTIRVILCTIHENTKQLMFAHQFQGEVLQLECHSIDVKGHVIAAIGMMHKVIALVTFGDFYENEIFVAGFHTASDRHA